MKMKWLFMTPLVLASVFQVSFMPATLKTPAADTAGKLTVKNRNSSYRVVIDKSDYEMKIYDEEGWLATYPVVFGNKKQDDKRMEGDRLTPEGTFRIIHKKKHPEWGRFMLLDYPNQESRQRFEERKRKGQIPKTARIGNGIGIHGTRPREEWVVDKYVNWTNGCVSVKYSDINELYDLLPIGTVVVIQK